MTLGCESFSESDVLTTSVVPLETSYEEFVYTKDDVVTYISTIVNVIETNLPINSVQYFTTASYPTDCETDLLVVEQVPVSTLYSVGTIQSTSYSTSLETTIETITSLQIIPATTYSVVIPYAEEASVKTLSSHDIFTTTQSPLYGISIFSTDLPVNTIYESHTTIVALTSTITTTIPEELQLFSNDAAPIKTQALSTNTVLALILAIIFLFLI